MKKKLTALILTLSMILSAVPTVAFAQAYTDVPSNHWAAASINKAAEYGIISGMGDGKFGMGKTLKRAEFASLLVRMFGWEATAPQTPSFKDNAASKWYYGAVETLLAHKAISYGNGNFRPEENITREEIAVMLVNALGYSSLADSVENTGMPFTDVTDNKGHITIAYDFGIVNGKSSTVFDPKGTALREEAAAMMVNAYNKMQSKTTWLHGFYALSSWNQKDMAKDMNAVSFGWSKMEYNDGNVVLNTTSGNNNEWVVPSGYEEAVALMENNGVATNLSVYMSNSHKGAPCKEILTNPENRKKAINAIIEELTVEYKAVGHSFYDGVTIDFENLKGEELRNGFTSFLNDLNVELDKINKTLYVAVQPKLKNSSEYFDGYDFKEINKVADKVILMAHDYAPSKIDKTVMDMGFTTTPVTPFDEVYYALKTTAKDVDKDKLVLALSISSAGWTVKDGAVTNSKALQPTPSEIYSRLNDGNTIKNYSDKYRNPNITYTDNSGATTIWYEDARSISDKINLAKMFGVNNISIWRIGIIPNSYGSDFNVWSTISGS